jgi:hypothetical protein
MCNLCTVRNSYVEVAAYFGVEAPVRQLNARKESYPGSPGLVGRGMPAGACWRR